MNTNKACNISSKRSTLKIGIGAFIFCFLILILSNYVGNYIFHIINNQSYIQDSEFLSHWDRLRIQIRDDIINGFEEEE